MICLLHYKCKYLVDRMDEAILGCVTELYRFIYIYILQIFTTLVIVP